MNEGITFRTDPDAERFDLRGRTYAIPFDRVWTAALSVIEAQRGWARLDSDDQAGWITARVEGWLIKRPAEVTVTIELDANAQTRVDLSSVPDAGTGGGGLARRRTTTFFRALDRAVGAGPDTTLDARTRPEVVACGGRRCCRSSS